MTALLPALFAITERESRLSLIAQLASVAIATLIGRFCLASKFNILFVSLVGGFAAMVAHLVVDGQGACLLIGFAPFIYGFATVGRRDLDGPHHADF